MTQTVGKRIREERRKRGVTAEELAVGIGRGAQTIWRWEWGHTSPRHADLERVAAYLGVKVGDLLPGDERVVEGGAG